MVSREIKCYVYLTLLMVYFVPVGLIFGTWNATPNHIYAILMAIVNFCSLVKYNEIKFRNIIIFFLVLFVAIFTGKFGIVDLIILPVIDRLIQKKDMVKYMLKKNKIMYVSFFMCLLYTLVYNIVGFNGRGNTNTGFLVSTASGEVNLAGLALFCLYAITKQNYRYLSKIIMIFGLFTYSRSYILAYICIIIYNIKFIKKWLNKRISKLTYLKLTFITSLLLFGFSLLKINFYLNNGISNLQDDIGFARLFNFNDYSNLYRLLAIYLVVKICLNYPRTLLFGISNEDYLVYGKYFSKSIGIPFIGIGPHNLFFARLKTYGISAIFEVYFISKYFSKIINKYNFGYFVAILLYSVVMGTGFNNYWLFLATLVLIINEEDRKNKNGISKCNNEYI